MSQERNAATPTPSNTPQTRLGTPASNGRFCVLPAVFVIVLDDDGRVLLHCRKNTGYMDGYYDFPSGHLEPDELLQDGAVREVLEETGLRVMPEDLQLVHIGQNYSEPGRPYINFFFRTQKWSGTPKICEPEKCAALAFFDPAHLPKVTPVVGRVLAGDAVADGKLRFSHFDLASFTAMLHKIDHEAQG